MGNHRRSVRRRPSVVNPDSVGVTPVLFAIFLGACTGGPKPGFPDSSPAPEDSDSPTGGICDPALTISPGSAQTLPFGLVQLLATGGTGQRLWTIESNASGAVINPENGGYVAGSVSGAVDVVLLTDAGCEGEARVSIEVVGPLEVAPGDARVQPGQSILYDVAGGSGSTQCSFFNNSSGGSLDAACRYTAGSVEGIDRVLFQDTATGELVYRKIEVSEAAIFGIDGQGALFLPSGAWMEPAVHAGSAVVDITVESGPFRAEDGRLWAEAPGEGVVSFTDRYTGDTVRVPVAALTPRTPVLPRDGERAGGGDWHRLGDVNGDGYMDAAFAWIEPSIDAWYGGMVAVYAGSADGLDQTPVMVFSGQTPEETLGRGITSGDVDNDGLVDLLIGADKTDRGGTNNGAVHIYRGLSTGFFETAPSRTLYGELPYDRLGTALALGDFDADGWLDLAAGAIDATNIATASPADGQGGVAIFLGSELGFGDLPDFTLYGQVPDFNGAWVGAAEMHVGESLAVADFDGDGLDDLAVGGSDGGLEAEGGAVLMYRGTTEDGLVLTRQPDQIFSGEAEEEFGRRVVAGDLNGDGMAELFIAAWTSSREGNDGGAVYMWRGSDFSASVVPFLGEDADWWMGGSSGEGLGADMDLYDQDGDGVDDLILGAFKADGDESEVGSLRVFDGATLGQRAVGYDATDDAPESEVQGRDYQDRVGQAVLGLGDQDGDGEGEVAALAGYDSRYGVQAGAPYAWSKGGDDRVILELPGGPAGHDIGRGLALVDLDADGYDDLLIGASGAGVASEGANSGGIFVYAGSNAGFSETEELLAGSWPSWSGSDRQGWTIRDIGDFNGDGFGDLAVVARKDSRPSSSLSYYDPEGCLETLSQAGSLWIHLGSASGISLTPSFVAFGNWESSSIYELIGNFDHNGDGKADVVFSSKAWNEDRGGLAVLYGRSVTDTGVRVLCGREEYSGGEEFDWLGSSITSVGDVDDDGCDELAVGASGEELSDDWYEQGVVRILWGWGGGGCRTERQTSSLGVKVVAARAGTSLAGGGDVDGDGIPDLVVGVAEYQNYFAELGAVWLVPGWYLRSLTAETHDDETLPPADEANWQFLMPPDGLQGSYAAVGTQAGSLFGESVALLPDPVDPSRMAVAIGVPQGSYGGAQLAGGVGIWRFVDTTTGFESHPWGMVVGETQVPGGSLGETLATGRLDGQPMLLLGAPLSDVGGVIDGGAAYSLSW